MKPRSCLFLPLLLGACLSAQGNLPTLTIGTWNLEFLGAEGDFRNKLPRRDEADYQRIGEKVRALGVAVLAVQEICGEAPLQKVAAAAGPSWRFVLGTTGGWDDGVTSQQIGFLYDARVVELLQAEELLALPRELEGVPIFHRVPVSACFRVRATGCDFRAVTVHLKAGQKAQDEQKRRLEAQQLHGWIGSLHQDAAEDQDLVLLGDFNSTYGTDPQRILEGGGSLQYLVPPTPSPTILHFPEPIDQVAAGPGFDELRRDSMTVHGDLGGLDRDQWRKTYSDHFPVTVTIAAAGDDDPAARFRPADPAHALPRPARDAARDAAAAPEAPARQTAAKPPSAPARRAASLPKAGATVTVRWADRDLCGTLLDELPKGPGGWLQLEAEGKRYAIPYAQIVHVTWQ